MKIRFSGKTYEFPPPVPVADEVVLDISRYCVIDLPKPARADRHMSLFNVRKVLFFTIREGIGMTLAKIRAVLAHRKLGAERALVIAIGTEAATGRPAVALGGQDCPYAEQLCFRRSLVDIRETGADGHDFGADAAALAAYCRAKPEVAAALRLWSRFSGQEPPVTLADALAEGRLLIAASAAPPLADVTEVSFADGAAPLTIETPPRGGKSGLFLAGAGTYPCAYALPIFARAGVPFDTVIEINPVRAAHVAERFGFAYADTDAARGLQRLAAYEAPILVIATYHSTHVEIAEQALAINPATKIMLEKPPVTTLEQLARLKALRDAGAYIEIGYNRRHIPLSAQARKCLGDHQGPVVMTCIVKELAISDEHWYRWPAQGTRITGNVCHWLDLGRYFIPAHPEQMVVVGPLDPDQDDGVTIIVCYADGSRLQIVATDRGNSLRGVQEFIELRRGDLTLMIEDFVLYRSQFGARQSIRSKIVRDKGHRRMYARFMQNVVEGRPPEYGTDDLMATTVQYIRASDAIRRGAPETVIDLTGGALA